MATTIKTEAELANYVMEYFTEWDLYAEVPYKGSIDIVAVKGAVTMTIEAKLKFNFQVLGQAYRNKECSHFSYVAVPKQKNIEPFLLRVCRNYGIGVLMVNSDSDRRVEEIVKPKLNRKISKLKLAEWMKNSIAGSLHGRETAYSFAMSQITLQLQRSKGRMSFANVFERTSYHWSSPTSAKACIIDYIKKGIIKNMRHDKGYIELIRTTKN